MGYHGNPHALKSIKRTSKTVQRMPNNLRHSFYKCTQIHIDLNKSLSLLQFEKWLEKKWLEMVREMLEKTG